MRPIALAAALLVPASLLTACGQGGLTSASSAAPSAGSSSGGSSSSGGASGSDSGGTSATGGASTGGKSTGSSKSSSAAGSSGSTASRGVSACTSEEVKVQVGQSDGAGSRIYRKLTFTNSSDHACQLSGAPKVSASSDKDPHVTTKAEVDGGSSSFVLKPGERAESTLSIGSAGAYADCVKDHASTIMISDNGPQAPGADPYAVPVKFDFCRNVALMKVTPYKKS